MKKKSILYVANGLTTERISSKYNVEEIMKTIEAARAHFKNEWKEGIIIGTGEPGWEELEKAFKEAAKEELLNYNYPTQLKSNGKVG